MERPVEIAAAAATLSLIAWSAVMPAFGPPPRAEAVLSPFHRKRNLPDQLRVRPAVKRTHSEEGERVNSSINES
jgi:hypothetical protein